ncbi:MAG TPA: hypothetical protein VHV30_05700 [Polyangiaceae bacterium]|jgi:hypothetical protein|nr:hypothetical protein [Polyangiaceae bacterium]
MPLPRRTARTTGVALLVVLGVAAGLGPACGGRRAGNKPVATIASSPAAAAAFEAIREAWEESDRSNDLLLRVALRSRLERFIAQFPGDGLVPMAEVALALEAMRDGAMTTADEHLARAKDVPPGTTRDLFTVARARRVRLAGDPEAALVLLRPLVGKSVDPLVRTIFEEELTASALATHREYEAISYMDAWLRASTEDEKPATVGRVTALVQKLPRDVLVGALQAMNRQRATLGYGSDIQRILAMRLVQIATSSGDADLARALLEADPHAFAEAGDAGAALGDLATSRRGLNVVEGRTLGLLLPTSSPAMRDESADVLRGVLWALGLPRGARGGPAAPAAIGEDAGASAPCGTLEPAPPLAEPSEEDAIRLVTRDDAGSEERTEASLDELAGEGAAMVLAGLDPDTSERALRWGEQHGVPVVALVPPPPSSHVVAVGSLGFVLGEARADVIAALLRAMPSLGTEVVAPVADASQIAGLVHPTGTVDAGVGRVDGLMLGPPASCDASPARAGEARFPIDAWKTDKTRAWLASGSPECAVDLLHELGAAQARGVVALTLEAAARLPSTSSLRVVSARAGIVPEWDARDPRADEANRFAITVGNAGWWAALGRDAATLARVALLGIPTDLVSEPKAVSERRAIARDRVVAARARLWTTDAAAFATGRTMPRSICTLEGARR